MLIAARGPRDWRKFFFQDLRVLVNGVESKGVLEADDEAGYAIRYRLDENGKPLNDGKNYLVERVEGRIEFVGTRRFSPDDAKAAAETKRAKRRERNLRNLAAQNGGAA
jgi:hypothetical protein